MAAKLCTACNSGRRVGTGVHSGYEDKQFCIDQDLCYPCGDEGQMSNEHHNGHEWISEDECWYCHPELNECTKPYVARKGTDRTASTRSTHHAHTSCYYAKSATNHERTPEARAACRKVNRYDETTGTWVKR